VTSFADLGLSAPLLRAVRAENYTTPMPIQAKAIPHLLAGRDLLGCARTGTGKTAAFALPILHRFSSDVRRPGPRRAGLWC
jgi:ATP-dependent RNA helicase RhlE